MFGKLDTFNSWELEKTNSWTFGKVQNREKHISNFSSNGDDQLIFLDVKKYSSCNNFEFWKETQNQEKHFSNLSFNDQ